MRPPRKDLKLIYELDSNYRQPYSRIARKIRMSQQLVNYKVKSLAGSGVLLGKCPLIDYSRFGYLSFRVFFKVNYSDQERFRKMIAEIKKHPNITMVSECEGLYDLMLVFSAKNPSSFNKLLREMISGNQKQLKNCMILTTVVEHHFPRKFLINSPNYSDTVVGGDREAIKIGKKDRKILKSLAEGRRAVVEIAGLAGVTPKTAISRLRSMERSGVIKGYRLLLDTEKIGVKTDKIFIKYHNISVERENQLRAFCQRNPNITEFIKTFGERDLELTVETRTREEFRNVFITIREKFEDIIEDFECFGIFRVHKKSTIPGEFFS